MQISEKRKWDGGRFHITKLIRRIKWLERHHIKFVPDLMRVWMRIYHNCEIPICDSIDESVWYNHNGFGIVITPLAIIGKNVDIQHSVTIGLKYGIAKGPVIEDNVVIGARAMIIGPVNIGHDSIIGACVVVKDVPPFSIVVGNPARIIKNVKQSDK